MNMQAKTSEQIMREALQTLMYKTEFSYYDGALDGCRVGEIPMDVFISKSLEEADEAESVSQQSDRELKRYFDGEAIGRADALQSFIESFNQEINRSISISNKRNSGYFDNRLWSSVMRDALNIAVKLAKEEM